MYAILFNNLMFSTTASFLTFMLLFLSFIEVIPCSVALGINEFLHFMPDMTRLAKLKLSVHKFVLQTRTMKKLRRIALTCIWVTYIVILSVRITFVVLINYNFNIVPLNAIFIVFCLAQFKRILFVPALNQPDKLQKNRKGTEGNISTYLGLTHCKYGLEMLGYNKENY